MAANTYKAQRKTATSPNLNNKEDDRHKWRAFVAALHDTSHNGQ